MLKMPTQPVYCYPWSDHFYQYEIDISTFDKAELYPNQHFQDLETNNIQTEELIDIYTDGSKTIDRPNVGAGYFIPKYNIEESIKLN